MQPTEDKYPAVAPSGAREWLNNNGHLYLKPRSVGEWHEVQMLLEAYADSLTAQLREELEGEKTAVEVQTHIAKVENAARNRAVSELTAERTKREAAERELKELRETAEHAQLLYEDLATREGSGADFDAAKALRAALRGKEGE